MMKRFAFVALFALAACSGGEEAEPVAEETVAAVEAVAVMAADGMPPEGTYQITSADGEVIMQTVNADGTYTNTDSEGTVRSGTWVLERPDYWCSQLEGEEAPVCFNETIDETGVWNSVNVNDPTDSSTIVRQP